MPSMGVKFSYGRREGQWVFIKDLDPARERGLLCQCVCPDCARPLQAHLGATKSWHFQHHVEDANCSPQPMTLLHAYVRDELARRTSLVIPGTAVTCEIREDAQTFSVRIDVPEEHLAIQSGQAEVRAGGVQPDVVYDLESGSRFALEVLYSHKVDAEKTVKLRRGFAMSVEFDVSDLPASGVGLSELEELLRQPSRWTWLNNPHLEGKLRRAQASVRWQLQTWRPQLRPAAVPLFTLNSAPTRRKQAQARLGWARLELARLRASPSDANVHARWLGAQDKVDRVAIACAALGLQPAALPGYFLQKVEGRDPLAFPHHAYSWQVVVFMKFGVGEADFSSVDAADWVMLSMPDRVEHEDGTRSQNGFTRTAAALHQYFLNLAAQGLLMTDINQRPVLRTFRPRFKKSAELREFLKGATRLSLHSGLPAAG